MNGIKNEGRPSTKVFVRCPRFFACVLGLCLALLLLLRC